jgi:hypothetical protein
MAKIYYIEATMLLTVYMNPSKRSINKSRVQAHLPSAVPESTPPPNPL